MTTNYEKITNKTLRELAIFLRDLIYCKYCPVKTKCKKLCDIEIQQWLESEVRDD